VLSLYLVLLLLFSLTWNRRRREQLMADLRQQQRCNVPIGAAAHLGKRAAFVALLYLLFVWPCERIGHASVYPGEWADLPYPDESERYGEEFEIVSGYDGAVLKAYQETFAPEASGQGTDDAATVIPMIFYGGNGQTMYSNTWSGYQFVLPAAEANLTPTNVTFAIYTFSWRGYVPNRRDGLTCDETANIADAMSLYEHVVALYPGRRPIITSHSLGTGAAVAVVERLSSSSVSSSAAEVVLPLPACLGLGMPFATMPQTTLEVAYYTSLLWLYAMPQWPSVHRIEHMNATIPLAVLSSGQDELIAPHHQREILAAASPSVDKHLFYSPERTHNDIYDVVHDHVEDFTVLWLNRCLDNTFV
jgi:hypothetical protein